MNNHIGSKQLAYFKEKIKHELEKIREDIGDLRYNLYVATVDQCDDYDQLREMAELEMQIDFIEYTKTFIKDRLHEKSVDIQDLKKVCYPPYDEDSLEIEENDMEAELDSEETLAALALALHKRLENEPVEERDKVYVPGERLGMDIEPELTEEEEFELLEKEMEEDTADLENQYDGQIDIDDTDEFDIEDTDDYFSPDEDSMDDDIDEDTFENVEDTFEDGEDYFIEDDSDENDFNNNIDEIDIDDNEEFFIEDEYDDSEENIDNFGENEEDDFVADDYFIESSDDDTLDDENFDESEFGEDYLYEDDEEDGFFDTENNEEDIAFDIADVDEFFIESDEDENEAATDEIDIDEFDDFFIESDEDDNFNVEDSANDEDDYFIEDGDDYFSSDVEDYIQDDPDMEINMDDYFTELKESSHKSTPKPVIEKPRVVTPDNVFKDERVQKIFNLMHRGVQEATKLTQKAAQEVTKATQKAVNEVGKKVKTSDFFKLDTDNDNN